MRAVALFDHEEVGSASTTGAGGPLMRDAIVRISRALGGGEPDATERCLQKSFLVSADMAHALHPNYPDKHEPDHKPVFHKCVQLHPLPPSFQYHLVGRPLDVRWHTGPCSRSRAGDGAGGL